MVHLQPLPGTPYYREGTFARVLDDAVRSALALEDGGADGCLVQTVERVYSPRDDADPARVSAAALVVRSIIEATSPSFLVGVQLMRNAVRASLAVARVTGASFIRAGTLVGATVTESGIVEADPFGVMEYRRKIDALSIQIVADVRPGQLPPLDGGRAIGEVAGAAQRVGADAVAVASRDERHALRMIASVRQASPLLPVVLGGHTSHENAALLLREADGVFVGRCLEPDGWGTRIDISRVRSYVEIVRSLG